MSKIYRPLLLLIILLNASLYPIKAASSDTGIPDVAQLKTRVKQLYEAEIKEDWRTWYNLTTLSLKKGVPKEGQMSYEEFEKQLIRDLKNNIKDKVISWGINEITLRGFQTYDKPPHVAVKMNIVIEVANEPKKVGDQTDYWVYLNKMWYWTWRGFPSD